MLGFVNGLAIVMTRAQLTHFRDPLTGGLLRGTAALFKGVASTGPPLATPPTWDARRRVWAASRYLVITPPRLRLCAAPRTLEERRSRSDPSGSVSGSLGAAGGLCQGAKLPRLLMLRYQQPGARGLTMAALTVATMALVKLIPKMTTALPPSLLAVGIVTAATRLFRLPATTLVDIAGAETFAGGVSVLPKLGIPAMGALTADPVRRPLEQDRIASIAPFDQTSGHVAPWALPPTCPGCDVPAGLVWVEH